MFLFLECLQNTGMARLVLILIVLATIAKGNVIVLRLGGPLPDHIKTKEKCKNDLTLRC